jgi:hypothetical protein
MMVLLMLCCWLKKYLMYLDICAQLTLKCRLERSHMTSRRDLCVGVVSEAALAECGEGDVRHFLNSVINLALDDGSLPLSHGFDRYLHLDLTDVQAMDLKGMAVVDGNRPVVAELDESAREQSWKTRAVSACATNTSMLAKGAVGVVVHVHL